jgi:hypothetical protein
MSRTSLFRFVLLALVSAALTACVDSPIAPVSQVDENQLATSFDGLAVEQANVGDTERSEEFRWAALSLRLGVLPARFEVTNAGEKQTFEAFVHSVHWLTPTMALRPATHRSFIAWRKTDSTMQVLLISSAIDSAAVLHPYSMRLTSPGGTPASPLPAALAAYFERGTSRAAWIGVTGWAKVAERASASTSETCSPPSLTSRPSGVVCQPTRYAVAFDIGLRRALATSNDLSSATDVRRITAEEQLTGGVRLLFACETPTSDAGCR